MTVAAGAVEQVVLGFSEAWNRHDMDAFAELFRENAEFVNVAGMWWKGREQIKRAHVATHASMFRESRLAISGIAIRFIRSDVALARASWRLTGQRGPGGEAMPERTGLLVFVLESAGGEWKIVDAQNTNIVDRAPLAMP